VSASGNPGALPIVQEIGRTPIREVIAVKKLVVVLTVALLLASCGDSDPIVAGSDPGGSDGADPGDDLALLPDIVGSWEVESVVVDGAESPAPNSVPGTVVVEPGGISGDAGCNRFFGEWSSTPDGIEVGELAITEIGCLDTSDWFDLLDALSRTATVIADGEARVLRSADGQSSVRLVPSGTLSSVTVPDEPEVEPEAPGTSEPGDAAANDLPADASDYIGLSEADASALAEERGHRWRVSEIDGEPQMLTMDHDPNRYNFAVADGVVIGVRAG